jgi:hypothetical protein
MLPNYEIQIVPSGMTIYNPPMSDDAFNPASGVYQGVNFNDVAKDICLGAGELAANKAKYIRVATTEANRQNSPAPFDLWINGLESAKTTEGCEWGAKRGRVAEVIRVLKRERDKWVKAKSEGGGGIGTIILSSFDPLKADWEAVALQIGDKKITKNEIRDAVRNAILQGGSLQRKRAVYDISLNGLKDNKNKVAWGAKRQRVVSAINLIEKTIRIPSSELMDGEPIVMPKPSPIGKTQAQYQAELKEWAEAKQKDAVAEIEDDSFIETIKKGWEDIGNSIGSIFGITPDDEAGDVTGGDTNGSGEDDKPDYTPLLAGGGIVVAVILIGVLVSAASKGKQGTLPK